MPEAGCATPALQLSASCQHLSTHSLSAKKNSDEQRTRSPELCKQARQASSCDPVCGCRPALGLCVLHRCGLLRLRVLWKRPDYMVRLVSCQLHAFCRVHVSPGANLPGSCARLAAREASSANCGRAPLPLALPTTRQCKPSHWHEDTKVESTWPWCLLVLAVQLPIAHGMLTPFRECATLRAVLDAVDDAWRGKELPSWARHPVYGAPIKPVPLPS